MPENMSREEFLKLPETTAEEDHIVARAAHEEARKVHIIFRNLRGLKTMVDSLVGIVEETDPLALGTKGPDLIHAAAAQSCKEILEALGIEA